MKKLSVILALIAMLFFIDACSSTRSTTGSGGTSGTGTSTTGTGTDNTGATGSSRTGSTASSVNQEFITDASNGGMMEVELGTLAVQNASSQEVKDFGRRMIDDHSKVNDELKSIAAKENVPVSGTLKSDSREDVDKLSKLSGSDFDKEYIDLMVKDHKEDVKNFEDIAANAQSPELKAFAQKTLPTLRQHLKMAQDIQEKLNNK